MNRLKELRKARGLTTTELGKIVGCSNPAITHYEHGDRNPTPEMLVKFADYFGVSIDYLIGYEPLTPEERAAGASETRRINITPIEDELLYLFRQLGEKRGSEAQRSILTVIENML